MLGDWRWSAAVPALEVYGLGAPFGRELLRWDRQVTSGLLVRLATVLAAYVAASVGSFTATVRQRCWWGLPCFWPLKGPTGRGRQGLASSGEAQLPVAMVLALHAGIACCMEGGAAIGLVACATWLALLPRRGRQVPEKRWRGGG